MKYRLKPRIVEASLQQDGFWAVNDGESICFFYEEQFKEKFEPVEELETNIDCQEIGHMWTWMPKDNRLCMRCNLLDDRSKQTCRFCEDPNSVITPETCCTGCSVLHNLNNQIDDIQ